MLFAGFEGFPFFATFFFAGFLATFLAAFLGADFLVIFLAGFLDFFFVIANQLTQLLENEKFAAGQ